MENKIDAFNRHKKLFYAVLKESSNEENYKEDDFPDDAFDDDDVYEEDVASTEKN